MQDHSFHHDSQNTVKKCFEIKKKPFEKLSSQFTKDLTKRVSQEIEKIDGPGAESALLLFQ